MHMRMSTLASKQGQLRALPHAWDKIPWGRDLDDVLFD